MSQQIAVRVSDDLLSLLDDLVAQAKFNTRAEAVRIAIESLVDTERRRAAGEAIVAGYLRHPQSDDEVEAASAAAIRSIHEEPW